ncbi:MAG: hypothetical protein K8S16_00245 [Bacteroidales bacterium]|nr:hypothetical protein [Bacteroidales bacterium]
MKKSATIFAFLMFLSIMISAQSLTWRFANAEVINAGANLQFDVEVMASVTGTFHRDLQVYFDYNTLGFGSDIVANTKITVTPLTLMTTHYVVVNSADNTSSKFAIITEATHEMTQSGSATYFNEVPTTFTGLLRFTIDIMDNTEMAGIAFDEALMNGGQYYQSTIDTDPVKYAVPCAYNNNLSTFLLSSAYGNVTYHNAASTPLDNFTVKLMQGGIEQASGITDVSGNFNISGIANGVYDIEHTWTDPRGGCNILDAINTRQFLGGGYAMDLLQETAGDVNENGTPGAPNVDILDAIFMQMSLSGPQPAGWTAPDFVFMPQTLTVANGLGTATYQGLCSGDPNKSHTP